MKAPSRAAPTQAASELRKAVDSLRPHFRRCALFTLVAGLLILAPSFYMLEVHDRVVTSRSHMTLLMLTLIVLASFVVMQLLEWAHSEEMHGAGLALNERLADRAFAVSFEANLKNLPGIGSGQPLNDLRTIRDFLPSAALRAAMESPVSLVFLLIVFSINPLLGWAALVGAILQTAVAWMNERSTQPPLSAAGRSSMAAQQYADRSLRSAQVIEAMGMLRDIHARWIEKQREFLGLQALASERAGVYAAMSKFLQTAMGSLLLGLGAWLILEGKIAGGGAMILASILGGRVLQPLVTAVSQWRSVVGARDAWKRLDSVLNALPPKPESMSLPAPRGRVAAENLVAAPPGSNVPVLRGVSFALAPGEVVAVIGPSAAGKTTLARVLTGIWPSAGGKARLDGADVHVWDKTELGPHVGYLPQGVELFEGTLGENIARFGPADPERVEAAARAVGLHEYILSLPAGYDTEIGADGGRLSGGQKQRVGLARALYGDPVYVVLDEPNASLDESGDAALAAAIQSYRARGTTFVVITHRAGILGLADKILLLRDGGMQAFGPRDEVLAALHKAKQSALAQATQQKQKEKGVAQTRSAPEIAA